MNVIKIKTSCHSELVDITRLVEESIPTGFASGLCHLFSLHTTAGLTINENADPDVRRDIDSFLNDLIPWDTAAFRHIEGNSAAHLKSSLMGFSQTVPVADGHLCLGTWQGIYFCEFDGPRTRKIAVNFIPDFS